MNSSAAAMVNRRRELLVMSTLAIFRGDGPYLLVYTTAGWNATIRGSRRRIWWGLHSGQALPAGEALQSRNDPTQNWLSLPARSGPQFPVVFRKLYANREANARVLTRNNFA